MNPQKTTVDWLRFRVKEEPHAILEALRPAYGHIGEHLSLHKLERGILGFQQACSINVGDMPLGRMDFGGASQREWVRVDIGGKGCEWLQDWSEMRRVEEMESAQLRRLDIALTTWEGQITHDMVVQAHAAGRFTIRRPPELRQITSSDPRAGRTCYIGKRDSDKFMRCYEKGFEMAAKYAARVPGEVMRIDDKAVEDIYRCEVEFKATGTDIPWEVIERRDQYFAGAYPFAQTSCPGLKRTSSCVGRSVSRRLTFKPPWTTAAFSSAPPFSRRWRRITGTSWPCGTK